MRNRRIVLRVESLEGRKVPSHGSMPTPEVVVEVISVETVTQTSYPTITVAEYVPPGNFYD
jgi:hypothetical protein